MSTLITRAQYMNNLTGMTDAERTAAHRAYYAQFVNANTVQAVARQQGAKALLASKDEYLNDIPLAKWDIVAYNIPKAITFEAVGDFASLAGLVCIAKEAARQYIEQHTPKAPLMQAWDVLLDTQVMDTVHFLASMDEFEVLESLTSRGEFPPMITVQKAQ